MKHTGKLFKQVLAQQGITLENLAPGRQQSIEEITAQFNKEEWTDSEIRSLSQDTDIDFGRFVSPWEYEPLPEDQSEYTLYVRYEKYNRKHLMKFLVRIKPIASEMGIDLS